MVPRNGSPQRGAGPPEASGEENTEGHHRLLYRDTGEESMWLPSSFFVWC
jgi:hypothetical protein